MESHINWGQLKLCNLEKDATRRIAKITRNHSKPLKTLGTPSFAFF